MAEVSITTCKICKGGGYLAESLMLYLVYAIVLRENMPTVETEIILKNVVTFFGYHNGKIVICDC